jgi:hypothetical protein
MHTVGVARVADVVQQEDVHETNLGASAIRQERAQRGLWIPRWAWSFGAGEGYCNRGPTRGPFRRRDSSERCVKDAALAARIHSSTSRSGRICRPSTIPPNSGSVEENDCMGGWTEYYECRAHNQPKAAVDPVSDFGDGP